MYQRQNGRGKSRGRGRFISRGGGRSHHQRNSSKSYHSNANSRSWGAGRVIHEELSAASALSGGVLHIAVQGCCHGQLDQIYKTIEEEELQTGVKVDLLLCCGDFQSVRNVADLASMAVPDKYKEIGTFYKYYSGEATAPVLTIFIGGNHEASLPLQELFYGGWVAENIYYLGAAGVVNFGGLRIAGISGIYKEHDYKLGHYERPPYNPGSLRSVYHVRNVETYRLQQLRRPGCHDDSIIDIMLSHDWPRGIERFGDTQGLLRKKQFFREEVNTNTLGSPVGEILLHTLQPKRWFAAHLHVKFEATVHHQQQQPTSHAELLSSSDKKVATTLSSEEQYSSDLNSKHDVFINKSTKFMGLESSENCCEGDASSTLNQHMTKFLALDKCLPQRHFLQIITIPRPESEEGKEPELMYDLEWLVILCKTAHLTIGTKTVVQVPNAPLEITPLDRNEVFRKLNLLEGKDPNCSSSYDIRIPRNFEITAPPHQEGISVATQRNSSFMIGNPQTDAFLNMLGIQHVVTVPYCRSNYQVEEAARAPTETAPIIRDDTILRDHDEISLSEEEELEEFATVSMTSPLEQHFDENHIPPPSDSATIDESPEAKKPRSF